MNTPTKSVNSAANRQGCREKWAVHVLNLREDIRSFPYGNYVIFFRYVGNSLEVVTIIEGHRDIEALFEER